MGVFDDHDGLGLAELVSTGAVSPAELLDEAIERTELVDQKLGVLAHRDFEHARAQIEQGLPDGPFRGVPFLRKDESCVIDGLITSSGTRLLADYHSDHTSTLAKRYLAAGLVIFGATKVPPFSVTIDTDRAPYGPCLNPWDLSRTPGGSSAGAAAVVASTAIPMAHGNDGGGSLRIPSAWSGAFTVKPSRGRLPDGPVYTEGWLGFATEGTITRSVRDCAAMMDATMGDELGSRYSCPQPLRPYLEETKDDCRPLRVAVMTATHEGEQFHPHHLEATTKTADLLSELGHHVEEAAPVIPLDNLSLQLYMTVAVDIANVLDSVAEMRGTPIADEELEAILAMFANRGRSVTAQQYAGINATSMEVAHAFADFQQSYDVVLSPTMPEPPLPIGEIYRHENDFDAFRRHQDQYLGLTQVQNVTGQPAMSIPLWQSSDNLPVGMMFVGRYGDESTLFSLAAQLERALPWWDRRPNLDLSDSVAVG